MTALLDRPRPARHDAPPAPRPVARFVLPVALALYATAAAVLVLGFDSIMEDALSRLSAASSVWSALDPKLAAVGFVWTPLPALLMVPFTPLRVLWPELVSTGLLAALLSAVAMAGAVAALHGLLGDLRVRPAARWTLTVLFALHPLVLVYSANGMTEALLLLFLLLATRRLLVWMRDGERADATHLVAAGLFLGLGYLARYEAIVAAAAVTVLVAATTALRTRRGPDRVPNVLVDALLVGLPAAAAFVLWAVVSWAVVGSPFEQFTSVYGNSALVAGGTGGAAGTADVGRQLLWLVPLAPLVLVAAAVRAVRRRDPVVLVPVVLFGSVLAFEWVLHLAGSLFGFLRYQIALVPLVAVLLGVLLSRGALAAGARRGPSWRTAGAVGLVAVVLGSALASSAVLVLTRPELASQEHLRVAPVVAALAGEADPDPGANGMWADDRALAARLDALDLPAGSVLADSGSAFAVVAASRNPRQFVITSDDGFSAALADPPAHVRYLLRNERGGVDTVRATWPDLGAAGGPSWARLVAEHPGAGRWSYAWTLWEVGA
ncbi:phospholipid carrier-dependent glycosyltransferase [Pseudonocardia broussonetiae]|uniref:Phospholipid carrier-dependent glycosyltransferase n=1 Tax=Pseudonocardia broussonetiae TaxID=2736640 RepID=A0A6M6JM37_9PSEU|nr:phospholipid carrier-dependent glycosyltransferase [Pseudonocardia broussonetiae]QJY48283.1 phospholipid carrier-dependent glycosyltransferase [Pseudonocardia broussonetiae]